ncbi:MAG: OB-fold domain-containing protein [Rhizobiaceae bacterium]|nr:OB-fold domain-containing protein [Rhizobiaceae bacterium]
MLQRSASSGRSIFYPRVAEPGTGATDLEWVEASGLATVYSTTTQRSRPPKPDVNVALVDLDEGPRMLARIDGIAPDAVTIGMRVRAEIVTEDDMPMVVFRPLADVAKA